MINAPFPPDETRRALTTGLPDNDDASSTPARDVAFTYLPPSHARALDPDTTIVEGMRGAGKSFWWAALHSEKHREFVVAAFPEVNSIAKFRTSQGFGASFNPAAPSKEILGDLSRRFEPRNIWKAVLAAQLEFGSPFPIESTWQEKTAWITENSESFDLLLYEADLKFASIGQIRIVLFDALDRLADDWDGIRPLARALLQLALDLRSLQSVRLKIFVRPDMLDDQEISSFPDASKLIARKVSLTWRRADLFALLYQCMGNAPQGSDSFKKHCDRAFGLHWEFKEGNAVWVMPRPLRTDEEQQREIFHAIAGPAMAGGESGHKRGFPYTWLPNHLLDGHEQVSPRSFIAALGNAAAFDAPDNWPYALHYLGIQRGVQRASIIRVNEISEDYPWAEQVMRTLRGKITVPCGEEDIFAIWDDNQTIDVLRMRITGETSVKLPPQHIEEGSKGVLEDLIKLGVILRMSNKRIQIPDVYRVAFGLGRRGGVRPLR